MREDPLYRPLPDAFELGAPNAAPSTVRRSGYSWSLAISVFVWLGGTTAALWLIVPRFAEMYHEAKVPMPKCLTDWSALSAAACRWPWGFALAALGLSTWAGTWRGPARIIARALVPIAYMLTIGAMTFSLFEPMLRPCHGIRSRTDQTGIRFPLKVDP